MRVPFLGRLGAFEWPVLIFSLVLVAFEYFLAGLTSLLPAFVIHFFDTLTYSLFKLVPTSGINKVNANPGLDEQATKIATAGGFVEMCKLYGYQAEEHIVKTTDGYLLGIHRIGGPKGSNWRNESAPFPKPVVYLHHGLLMNSEIWVANIDPNRCLPFVLAEMGYDVWLGNNRGNKYSKKHVTYNQNSTAFWNFSIDDFALYDIPDTINYILYIVNQRDLVYVGFSQGSAQAFATLSINPELNKKVRLFIALAPAMAPPGLKNTVVDSLMRASPSLIYLFFGRKAIMKSATYWQSIMYPPLFIRTIDSAISSLFNWGSKNITYAQKLAAYPHLYSYTSVKSVVHWFQIIRSGRFHMYDDDGESFFGQGNKYFYRVASFPTQNITSPILLLYGKSDSLVDIDVMVSELPEGTASIGFDTFEHLDMIWGQSIDKLIFPYVFSALKSIDHAPVPFSESDPFEEISQRHGPLPTVKLNRSRRSSIDTLNLPESLGSQLHSNKRLNLSLQLTNSPYNNRVLEPKNASRHMNHIPKLDENMMFDRLLQAEGNQANGDRIIINSAGEFNREKIQQPCTPRSSKRSVSASGLINNYSHKPQPPPYNWRARSESVSYSSTTDSYTANESQNYGKLAHRLSNSFSNSGINFGSSQPVVEVIHSD